LARLVWPLPGWRPAALAMGAIGLFTHTLYIAVNQPPPAAPSGSLLLLAWVLALFYLYGTVHHARQAWAVFVLPVVIGLVGLSFVLLSAGGASAGFTVPSWVGGERFWGVIHGTLILLAAVGVSVGFLASVMYLVQARRLRKKLNPGRMVPLLSLERLEAMDRRGLYMAFPRSLIRVLLGSGLAPAPTRATVCAQLVS